MVKSGVPGITSSLFTNPATFGGNLPVLNAMLKKVKNRTSDRADNLLLALEKILPNEFVNFPTITALTFPDKFPVPISEHHFMGTSMMNATVRQHLLDHYDDCFCDVDLIFWWYLCYLGIAQFETRVRSLKNILMPRGGSRICVTKMIWRRI